MIRTLLAVAVLCGSVGPALAAATSAAPAQITGTVALRERRVLPSDALLHVQLLDVSQPNATPIVVAETSLFAGSARVSIPFVIPYVPGAIDATHRYVVRASIASDGATRFASDAGAPVLTDGAAAHVELLVVASAPPPHAPGAQNDAAAPAPPSGAAETAARAPIETPAGVASSGGTQPTGSLEGTHWKLIELGGVPPAKLPDVPDAFIEFTAADKRIAAVGGCNRLMGTYATQGASLTVSAGGMTMMACPEPLGKQELAFTDALRATKGYRIAGGFLELLDGGKVLARFAAVPK